MQTSLCTLCYIQKDNCYLMLHRVVKKNDVNKDKWIGVGGHFEEDESPEDCLLREVREETGYTLTDYRFRGIVTFVSGDGVTEYMHLYTADGFTGEPIACNEGVLEWVPKDNVWDLNLWEGDKIFFRLIDEDHPFFSLKLTYDGHGVLTEAILDGKALELFDIVDRDGTPTGLVKERGVAHLDGSPHPTVHTWITRTTSDGRLQVLLQQRSHEKDAWPDCYDISSAGHIPHGSTPLASAVREAKEELGLTIQKEDLHLLGHRLRERERVFHDRLFHDCEYSTIYLYQLKNPNPGFVLQESEVARIRWMTLRELNLSVKNPAVPHCLDDEAELEMLRTALQNLKS